MVGRTARCRRGESAEGPSVIDADLQRRVEGGIPQPSGTGAALD